MAWSHSFLFMLCHFYFKLTSPIVWQQTRVFLMVGLISLFPFLYLCINTTIWLFWLFCLPVYISAIDLIAPLWLLANYMELLHISVWRGRLAFPAFLCLSVIRLLPLSFQVLQALLACQTRGTCSWACSLSMGTHTKGLRWEPTYSHR